MRSAPVLFVLACVSLASSCGGDVAGTGLAINDPLDLIDDVDDGTLRLFVLPAESYACEATTGLIDPWPDDFEQGAFEEAVADVVLDVASSAARAEVQVPGGEYTVLVRGKGTDPVTMIPDTFIATGCARVAIGAGETQEIRVTLIPIVGEGNCGDGTFSPDEQCEDGNTTDGDGCSATCRTEPFVVSTTAMGQDSPSVAGASARRWALTYTNTTDRMTLIRLLEANGGAVTTPSALMNDVVLGGVFTTPVSQQHIFSDVAVSSTGRVGVSFTHFGSGGSRVRVGFLNENRTPDADSVVIREWIAPTPPQFHSSAAFAGNGAFMVVLEDSTSPSGLSGQIFASGSTTPIATDPFVVGEGATLASDPVVSGASDHFVVAFTAGGDVFVQRFGTDGSARDAAGVAVLEDAAGMQNEPEVAALSDGRALVAWRDTEGDGAGSAIRARAFDAAGAAAGDAFVLNTTTAGDQSAPSITSAGDVFLVGFQSGASVRARVIAANGTPLPNRDRPPTTADFEVAASGAQPALAAGGPGGDTFMATWAEGGDIRARLFTFAQP